MLTRENRDADRTQTDQFIVPPSSVIEGSDGYTLEVEMPGVNKDGLDISIENNELTIIGRRSLPKIEGTLIHHESRQENFRRTFELDQRQNRAGPCDVDFAQSGARQAAQDHCFLTVSFGKFGPRT